ncbi:MAG: hypothetical protein WAW06_12655, partial [bacterium]
TFVTMEPPLSIPGGGYGIHVLWFGMDPDGTIDHFEWRTSETDPPEAWQSTISTGSSFVLEAGFSGQWTFAVRAVDNDGAPDRSPASLTVTLGMLRELKR